MTRANATRANAPLGRALCLAILVAAPAGVGHARPRAAAARPAPARPARQALGTLALEAWDARKDVFFQTVSVWREGCDLAYRFSFRRRLSHPLRVRAFLSLDAGPADTATPWAESSAAGAQSASGKVATPGCWVRKARGIKRVRFEAAGDPAPRPDAQGRVYLGRVTFNRWGSSGDVYYRHIRAWKAGCRVHYQFLYKRRTAIRRRLRMHLSFDKGELQIPWSRSKNRGWREIVGSMQTPGCWAEKATGLRSGSFESERY